MNSVFCIYLQSLYIKSNGNINLKVILYLLFAKISHSLFLTFWEKADWLIVFFIYIKNVWHPKYMGLRIKKWTFLKYFTDSWTHLGYENACDIITLEREALPPLKIFSSKYSVSFKVNLNIYQLKKYNKKLCKDHEKLV